MKRLILKSSGALLLGGLLLTGSPASAGQVSIGIQIGPPPPARVVHVMPRRPGADFVWVDGYWQPVRNRYVWHDGYWVRPPARGVVWVAPRYSSGYFYDGHWSNDRRFDRDRDRFDRGRRFDDRRDDHRPRGRARGHYK